MATIIGHVNTPTAAVSSLGATAYFIEKTGQQLCITVRKNTT